MGIPGENVPFSNAKLTKCLSSPSRAGPPTGTFYFLRHPYDTTHTLSYPEWPSVLQTAEWSPRAQLNDTDSRSSRESRDSQYVPMFRFRVVVLHFSDEISDELEGIIAGETPKASRCLGQ